VVIIRLVTFHIKLKNWLKNWLDLFGTERRVNRFDRAAAHDLTPRIRGYHQVFGGYVLFCTVRYSSTGVRFVSSALAIC
jgi:hypothetical protein